MYSRVNILVAVMVAVRNAPKRTDAIVRPGILSISLFMAEIRANSVLLVSRALHYLLSCLAEILTVTLYIIFHFMHLLGPETYLHMPLFSRRTQG